MRGRVLLLASALVLAGCLSSAPQDDEDTAPGEGALAGRLVGPVNVSTDWPGAEPVVDVGPEGTIYVEGVGTAQRNGTSRNVNKVFRSTDGGESWTDVTPQGAGQEQTGDGFVAVGPDGTVYAANVFGLTVQVFRSVDQGESWTPLNIPRPPTLGHRHWILPLEDGTVHLAIEALPPGAVPFLAGGPTTEGAADTQNKGMWYTRSTDRGDTWTTPQRIDPQINYVGQSNMVVTEDGESLFVVRYEEDDEDAPLNYDYTEGRFYVMASEDGGDTWERREAVDLTAPIGSALTSLAVDAEGTLFFVWAQQEGNRSVTHVAVSEDAGRSWTQRTLDLGPGTQAMPFAAARGPGVLELLWYDAHADGMPGEVDAAWHVHAASVANATTSDPEIATRRISGTVHEGNICVLGPACSGDQDRSLLDYVWVDVGPGARTHLAYASTMHEDVSAIPVYAGLPAQDSAS